MKANALGLPDSGFGKRLFLGISFTIGLLLPLPALALPIPEHCQVDLGGANDYPGQRDVTRMCVALGDSPWELYGLLSLDELNVQGGGGSLDSCMLLDTDADGNANHAVCITLRSSGPDNENLPELSQVRLLACDDAKPDRCTNPQELSVVASTTCELSFPDNDPFSPAAPDGPGSHYPYDSQIVCGIDYADFGHATEMHFTEACSYPSRVPNSDPADCVLFATCTSATDCDDGNACTADTCDATGFCLHAADPSATCADGLFCNGAEFCNSLGYCENAGTPLDCGDGVACTIDDCDELLDVCIHDPRNTLCDDGAWCNGVELCDLAGCVAGTPPDCGDTIGCTADACDEGLDACVHAPVDADCDDGAWCNGTETCDLLDGCVAGTVPDCSDAVACTLDACDEAIDSCSHAPNDAGCDDGAWCNGPEKCNALGGCTPGTAPACDDGVECTVDSCSEAADTCLHDPRNDACDDGQWCNGVEICTTAGCEPGTAPCDQPATCDETDDECVGCVTDADCSDGVWCNGQETCNAATGACSPGVPVACGDGVDCTIDTCDEALDACRREPHDALCSDDLFCNGEESCDPLAGCEAGPAPSCDDDVACTSDSCVEETDSCRHEDDDTRCDDGLWCNGAEHCIAGYGCEDGEPVACPPDGYGCSVESCDEAANACESDFSLCVCGDGELVPGEECEPPETAGTYEDCNNRIDDDADGETDCSDTECKPGSPRGTVCGENCDLDRLCRRPGSDPAVIKFQFGERPDSMWIHGHFVVDSEPDPSVEGIEIEISNGVQPIYFASLGVGDLEGNMADASRFNFSDREARRLGADSKRGGLGAVRLEYRDLGDERVLAFRIRAYGDFSAATRRVMSTQISVGGEVGGLTEEWTAAKRRWILRQSDY